VSVATTIAADAEMLYELVSDVTNMGRWSPETTACRWLGDATGPAIGARFRGANRDGWRRWSTTCTVVVAEVGQRFAFEVDLGPLPVARWTYDFIQAGDATRVVETWTDRRLRHLHGFSAVLMGVPDRAEHNRRGMDETLARLRAAAEHDGP
jgi:hypothetical protein